MQLLRIFINLSALIFHGGSSARIEVENNYHDDLHPDSFTLRCEPESDGHCDKAVILMEMTKDGGKTIASVRGNDKITYGPRMQSFVKAFGHVESDVNKCFLSVTFTDAVKEDSGLYSCSIIYLDSQGKRKEEHGSANVSVEGVELQDVLRQVVQKLTLLEHVVRFNKNETDKLISSQENKINTIEDDVTGLMGQSLQVQQLISKGVELQDVLRQVVQKLTLLEHVVRFNKNETDKLISSQENKINTIEDDVTGLMGQSLQVQQLISKEQQDETIAAFSAVYNGREEFNVGDTLVCSKAELNIGNNYNTQTGEFTAPCSGLYVFHLVVSGFVNVEVRVNDVPMTSVSSGSRFHSGHQAVAHTVVKLEQGDEVKPVVMERVFPRRAFAKRNSKITLDDYHSMFSGYLLKALSS